ncbi:MAG: PTS sugar transporter subunit IIA [Peptoniphilaceae bacterium]|nr:PTS sugar transporter subunit IIA [Peptoniphilaceae bacterium]MDY6018291.1 PTS sugar transporter subunit IIA [Anaerococcus sp.]
MNKRQLQILKFLNSIVIEVPLEFISKKEEVSIRTVRSDIEKINVFLKEKSNSRLVVLDNKVKFINNNSFNDIINKLDFYNYSLNKYERLVVESLILIFAATYITYEEISELISVSRSTIIQDSKDLKDYLIKHKINLKSLSNSGIIITNSSEEAIREFFLELVDENEDIYKIFLNSFLIKNRIISENEILKISKITKKCEIEKKQDLNEKSFFILTNYIIFMLYRNKNGKIPKLVDKKEDIFFQALILRLNSEYNIKEFDKEKWFLISKQNNFRMANKQNAEAVKIQVLTGYFIWAVSEDLSINLNDDYLLFQSLSEHLQRVFLDGLGNIIVYPDVQMIVDENKDLIEIVKKNSSNIEKAFKRKFTFPEISYIVVYFSAALEKYFYKEFKKLKVLVVFNSGRGTGLLLKTKLEEKFKFNVIDVISPHLLTNIDKENIDLIISTVDIEKSDIPIVKTSSILNVDEIRDITEEAKSIVLGKRNSQKYEKKINTPDISLKVEKVINSNNKRQLKEFNISDYLKGGFIQIDVRASDWKDSIFKASKKLLDANLINENYINSMIENILENGPYIVVAKGFAIPHAKITDGVRKTGFNLIRLKNPVYFGTNSDFDPIKYVCVLAASDQVSHLNAFFEIINLFQDKNFVDKLDKTEDVDQILRLIKERENERRKNG